MNARIEVTSSRAEARRLRTLSGMRAALHALGMELGRISTLGDDEAALALREWQRRINAQGTRAESLAQEFETLATEAFEALEKACIAADEHDDAIEAEEAAAARWDRDHP